MKLVVEKNLITLVEASKKYNTSVVTIRRKIRQGTLPAYKPFGKVLISMEDLDRFVKKSIKLL